MISIIRHTVSFSAVALMGLALSSAGFGASTEQQNFADLLARISDQTTAFLDQFSDVKCTERLRQQKLNKDNTIAMMEDSTYDYLVILTNAGGELNVSESRIPIRQAKPDRRNTPMLVSNGLATLFLLFHPYYSAAFTFTSAGDEVVDGRLLEKVRFRHIPGMKSPAALALRGREYPLELSGMAWIEPQSGSIAKIQAGIGDTLLDVGLKSLNAEIDFSPVPFSDIKQVYWFPNRALVEVDSPRQHWRNLHQFTAYRKFSVSTAEQVAQ
jgi:hypothetical protein